MKYSLNPFKWLLWLFYKIKYRNSKWQKYYVSKSLNKRGREKVKDELRKCYKVNSADLIEVCII